MLKDVYDIALVYSRIEVGDGCTDLEEKTGLPFARVVMIVRKLEKYGAVKLKLINGRLRVVDYSILGQDKARRVEREAREFINALIIKEYNVI